MNAPSRSLAYPLLALVLVGCGTAAAVQKDQPARALPNVDLLTPAPWTPPKTSLPKDVVDETAFLLAHGLGDPRGGEYRKATASVGSLWGQEEKPQEVRGWVSKDRKRVVLPNGLTYDAVSVGEKADLAADVRAEIARWNAVKGPKLRFVNPRGPIWGPLGVRLLLVAGRTDLAEAFHAALPGDPNRYGGAVMEEFLSAAFDQAVTAHMRGDDATALRVGRMLARVRPDFEARLLATVDPRTHAAPSGRIVQGAAFPFLDPVPDLIADATRRLQAPPRGPFDPTKATVAELIDRLDEVKARQWGQPGGVDLADDPIVQTLAAKGDAAAEPLFDAMERDPRLTRSVSFARDFFPGRNLIPVRSAALAAFQAFAQTDNFPAGAVTQLDVPKLRAYWQANRGKTGPDRWFDTLADDRAGWRRWEEAARRLFDPQGTQRNGIVSRGPGKGAPYAERVRSRTNPSLSDLLARRARDMVNPTSPENGSGVYDVERSLQFATWLGSYDPPASIPVLREMSAAGLAKLASGQGDTDTLLNHLVPALEARAAAGDATAWRDYAEVLSKVGRPPSFDSKALRPMVDHPDVPEVREATRLLTAPGSVYNSIERMRTEPGLAGYDPVVVSPLLKLPGFRASVLAALGDRAVIGTSWIDDRGNGWMEANGKPFPSQGTRPDPADPKPPAREKRPLRHADAVAHALARLKGAPKFQPFWTVPQKDAAIAKIRAFLMANENRIDDIVPWPNNWKDSAFGP